MFRRPLSLHLPVLMAALLPVIATACGSDLSDNDFGGVDLKPFFGDTSSKAPPLTYSTVGHAGFFDGVDVKYLDFGWSTTIKDTPDDDRRTLLGLGPTDKIPKVAPVNPMYFFFDKQGNPMFAPPMKEKKTGHFVMPGGSAVRNVNPNDDAPKDLAYPVRTRNLLKDPFRNTADYQRPIVDVIFDREKESALQRYSGLWEFVKVTAPSGYQPDQIKSWATLEEGVKDGSFVLTNSKLDPTKEKTELLAINCPLIDSRSIVLPTVSAFRSDQPRIPQPRIELWYRRKRIDCFLVNGWESLGKTTPGANGDDSYTLYKSNEDKLRIGVLDTDVIVLGEGVSQKRQIVSPVGQLFIPRISARSQYFYAGDSFLTTGSLPRRNKADPPGYRPVRWLWNIDVTDFGDEFNPKKFLDAKMTNVRNIDDAKLSPREGLTVNFPLVSQKLKCKGATEGNDPCTSLGMVCGGLQDGVGDECESRKVRYGEICAPTVAQCRDTIHVSTASVPKGDAIEDWFFKGSVPPKGEALDTFNATVPKEWRDIREPYRLANRGIVERGDDLYSCLSQPVTEQGHCYLSCNGGKTNRLQGTTFPTTIKLDTGEEVKIQLPLDSRCGGNFMPGFRCLPVTNQTNESGGSRCLRDCNSAAGVSLTKAICQIPTLGYFSDEQAGLDIANKTTCQSVNVVDSNDPTKVTSTYSACIRDPSFAPFSDPLSKN